jgi:DNA-binding GntR family transcriptional regulator
MIERKPLREEVERQILVRIADHRLPAGERVRESRLAAELDVSRTPLREAMLVLAARGFLQSDMGRGFLVPPIVADDFRDQQGMLARLAPHALELGGRLPGPRIMELNNLVGRVRVRLAAPVPERADAVADMVHRWHRLCVAGCPNALLRDDVERLAGLSRRYWREAVIRDFDPAPMIDSCQDLYDLLRTGRTDEAVVAWEHHITGYAGEAGRRLAVEPGET